VVTESREKLDRCKFFSSNKKHYLEFYLKDYNTVSVL
jgi:hypothetical protein